MHTLNSVLVCMLPSRGRTLAFVFYQISTTTRTFTFINAPQGADPVLLVFVSLRLLSAQRVRHASLSCPHIFLTLFFFLFFFSFLHLPRNSRQQSFDFVRSPRSPCVAHSSPFACLSLRNAGRQGSSCCSEKGDRIPIDSGLEVGAGSGWMLRVRARVTMQIHGGCVVPRIDDSVNRLCVRTHSHSFTQSGKK